MSAKDDAPPLFPNTPGLRVDRHRATMAHLASVYPCHTDTSIGERGPYIGVNVTGGGSGWYFDPFELYATGVLTNPNVIRANDRFGLVLYLLLLTCASQKPYDVSHHSSVWARALGLPEFSGATARTRVSKAWHRLIERQLVSRERMRRSASLTPLKEDGSGDDYERPSSRFINIRHGLWTAGPSDSEGPVGTTC